MARWKSTPTGSVEQVENLNSPVVHEVLHVGRLVSVMGLDAPPAGFRVVEAGGLAAIRARREDRVACSVRPMGVTFDDYEELRLGLVLNGGVSLAVWMGGVTQEIDRLRRAGGAYGEVLELLATTARVDVIAGASAGGINGGLLATAVAHGRPLNGLRHLWVTRGALSRLVRSPFESHPPSLMDGDGYFLDALNEGLAAVAGPSPAVRGRGDPVHLTMVTSVLSGINRGLADDFGGVIPDATHLGEFTFRRDGSGRDDWADAATPARIALAARCSASFPFAFEPSFVPVGESLPGRPDMAAYVNFRASRFAVDGGALMNKPFAPALQAIAGQPASRQVRRVLVYVAPDPGAQARDVPDVLTERPRLAQTILASVVTMPRTESVARELAEIRAHNDGVAGYRLVRDSLYDPDRLALAGSLFELYRARRASESVANILRRLDAGLAGRAGQAGEDARSQVRDRAGMRRDLVTARLDYLPSRFPEAGDPAAPPSTPAEVRWKWGIRTVEAMAMTVLDLLVRGLALAPLDDTGTRAALRGARAELHALRAVVAAVRDLDDDFWELEAGHAGGDGWAAAAFRNWALAVDELARRDRRIGQPVFDALAERAVAVARILVENRQRLLKVASRAGDGGRVLAAGVSALSPALSDRDAAGPAPARRRDTVTETLRALLAMEVVVTASTSSVPTCDQLIELMLISGDGPNAFDARARVAQKLTGVNLGHFAAFYKCSWRANDWMFGRLDGAWRLAQVLLAPGRLRQLYAGRADHAFGLIEAVALGTTPAHEATADARAYLAAQAGLEWDRVAARDELDYLDDPARPVPPALPACARGVARRLQLGILVEEIPAVADAVRRDVNDGADPRSGGDLMVAFPPLVGSQALPAASAVDRFRRCEIGTEKVAGEFGSDLFTATVSTVAAVGVNAASGIGLGLGPIGVVLGALRTFSTAFVVLARSVVRNSRTAFAVTVALLTVGGLITALPFVSSDLRPSTPVTLVGVALVVAGGFLAWMSSGAPGSLGWMVLLTVAGFVASLALIPVPADGDAPLGGWGALLFVVRPVAAVAALVLIPWVFASATRWRRRREPARG